MKIIPAMMGMAMTLPKRCSCLPNLRAIFRRRDVRGIVIPLAVFGGDDCVLLGEELTNSNWILLGRIDESLLVWSRASLGDVSCLSGTRGSPIE